MFADLVIHSGSHQIIPYQEFILILKELKKSGHTFAVGTDSQIHSDTHTVFVTCLVAHNPGHGARFWYTKERIRGEKGFRNLQHRLMNETMKSIWAASEVEEIIGVAPEVHLDLGTDPAKSKSSKYLTELTGMVTSQGYDCAVKPNAWASDCADKFTKN